LLGSNRQSKERKGIAKKKKTLIIKLKNYTILKVDKNWMDKYIQMTKKKKEKKIISNVIIRI